MARHFPLEGVQVGRAHGSVVQGALRAEQRHFERVVRLGHSQFAHARLLQHGQPLLDILRQRCDIGELILRVLDLPLPLVQHFLYPRLKLRDLAWVVRLVPLHFELEQSYLIVD